MTDSSENPHQAGQDRDAAHVSGRGEGRAWPRSSVDPRGDETRCGHWGGHRSDGELCVAFVVAGTKRCFTHSGKPRAKAKAEGAILLQLAKWGLDGHSTMADAGETLLKLVTQSAARVQLYSGLLENAYANASAGQTLDPVMRQGGVAALIGYRFGVDREGRTFPIEEAIRGLAQLEFQERKFCGELCTKAIAAGLAERSVRLAEQQGALLVTAIRAMMDELDLSQEQQARVGEVVSRNLRAITGQLT